MYQALGLPKLLSIFLFISALIAVLSDHMHQADGVTGILKAASQSASWSALLIIAIGQSPVFKWIWQCKLIQKLFFPYIHGKWSGTISSNWGVLAALRDAATDKGRALNINELNYKNVGGFVKEVDVEIEATLLHISMKLIPRDVYSDSFTVLLKPVKNGENGYPRLYYMYKSVVRVPHSTDTSTHFGAAWMDVIDDGHELTIRGVYWTDREWTKGINTAGELNIKKVS